MKKSGRAMASPELMARAGARKNYYTHSVGRHNLHCSSLPGKRFSIHDEPADLRRYDRGHAAGRAASDTFDAFDTCHASDVGAVTASRGKPPPRRRRGRLLEPWSAPLALVNGSAVGLVPILLPIDAARYGIGHVGLVMGAFNLGALAAPAVGMLADRYRAHRLLATACAALSAVSLWLFPVAAAPLQLPLGLANGAGFAGAVTVANLLIVERRPRAEWNRRLGWLETVLSVGQGGALVLAAWLSGLSARNGLLIAAFVPAAAVPLCLVLIPRMGRRRAAPPTPAVHLADPVGPAGTPHPGHRLASIGHVGEWGPASPSRVHHPRPRSLAGIKRSLRLLRGPFGWLLAAWIPAYAGTAIIFALYPVLFSHAFGVRPEASAVAFAVVVFLSLPLFLVAGRVAQRRGPAVALAGAFAARVVLLALLAALAAVGHVPAVIPLAAFGGIMFAWSFLSVASPGLTGQLVPRHEEGDAQGALNAASGLAGLVGSVAGGTAADLWGYPAALGIGAGAVLLGLVVFGATQLRARRSAAPRPAAGSARRA
jgi:MFS transporter, DHA1 family, tetracycline resistance protein